VLELTTQGRSSCCRWLRICCCCGLAILALPMCAMLSASSGFPLPELPGEVHQALSDRWPTLYRGASDWSQRSLQALQAARSSSFGDMKDFVCSQSGGVRETTVREMTLRETTIREHTREEYDRLQAEHAQMQGTLTRLQYDIDDALHRGQDMVCWPV